ncbi:DUF2322 family protein [Litorisediminicola beolgyonensis]|uniref:DUF2322 family protein n=1 Tax=Litorisediminicola beolgyonensis TaxID=1173614 RepID=A0ABW3ZKM4_9RHOB
MIQPSSSFKENLQNLPSIEGGARLETADDAGDFVAYIENQPGKQGSFAVYQHLLMTHGVLIP